MTIVGVGAEWDVFTCADSHSSHRASLFTQPLPKRAFTRNLFFRRGQQVVEPNAEDVKQHKSKSKSRSRSRSHSRQDTGNVLQPSSQNASAADKQQVVPPQDDDSKELSAKSSSQDLPTEGHKENEGVAPLPVDLGQRTALGSCHNVSLASQDLGNEDEFPDEMFQTPTLGSDADEVSPSSPIFAVTVTEPYPSDMTMEVDGLEISSMPIPLLSAYGQGVPSLAMPTSLALMPRSLETGLSDITEADEPSTSIEFTKSIGDGSVIFETGAGAETCKANLSFSSFGSSYASTPTQSANASLILPEPTPASSPSIHVGTIEDESVTSSDEHIPAEEHVRLHPTLLSSLPPALRSVRGQSRTPVAAPMPASATVEGPQVLDVTSVIPAVSIKEDPAQCPKNSCEVFNIPAPVTYAEAMNLALQYPEMSSKLLNEPLASACPTPARAVSPSRTSARTGPSPAASPQKNNQVHTADRPNWAVAPDEPKLGQRSRSRGRTRARKPVGARGEGQDIRRSNEASNASNTPPANTPNLPMRPALGKPTSRQQSPEKPKAPQAVEKGPVRDLREEKAEPWHNRVTTWVEKTSTAAQVSVEKQPTPMPPSGSSNANATAPVAPANPSAAGSQETVAPQSATNTRSPLNPNAPAWEYRPHLRAATSSTPGSTTQPSPAVGPCAISPSTGNQSQVFPAPTLDLEADLERLRAMLRECGLEERKLSARLTTPGCSNSVRSTSQQQVQPAMRPEATNQALPPSFGQGIHRPFAPTLFDLASIGGGSTRLRTQTHLPVVQSVPWQSAGTQARPVAIPQPGGQIVYSTTKPGANAIPIIMPQTGAPLFALPTSSAPAPILTQPSQLKTNVAPNIALLSTASRAPAFPLSVPPQQPIGTASSAASLGGNQVFRFGQAGKHLGLAVTSGVVSSKAISPATAPAAPRAAASPGVISPKASSSTAALLPPGGERSRPPVTGANAIAAPTTRFYGIETPRVVFDKHGWTVNHS
ncbi:hypothetical protein C8Q70DRAFT_972734 [Cubamyces menziesii]|nr:hypothetical protein C8Q70DRAFT_972734 [Cubamyces menziesii]